MLPDATVQKIDLALEKIMKNGSNNDNKSDKQQELAVDEGTNEFDDNYDGNE